MVEGMSGALIAIEAIHAGGGMRLCITYDI
jgi:hypothetical protein